MSLFRLYTRVLELLGKEARLGWILAGANLLLAGAQFAEPVLFGRIVDVLSGNPSNAHDPVALVEDAATGKRYVAAPGQRFKGDNGAEYLISAVRPNQMVIQDLGSGAVQTIPLRGPRG